MEISLEHIAVSRTPETFRVAFHSATERCLLPYPKVTGLTFTNASGNKTAAWRTRVFAAEPLDDFVLNPGARIAFDLYANVNGRCDEHRWMIDLPAGTYNVHFAYSVDRDTEWYDFLAKRSRFAALTPIWRGSIESNTIPFTVTAAVREDAK
ncbi:hypothetical protein Poly51_62800 [Rubripirellula tenax]|uniref:Uncharacterized protein n=1 Tax=Rubripirellula tenax TaxID=2528015 RepID=A0A5C6E4M1_9BACT|nr:hypothetical protein Poly51_62800 [Rubripirellula tenax]